jgi:transposase
MDVVYARCCGLDVHKNSLVACLITTGADGQPQKDIRPFGAMTADVLALADWLTSAACRHGVMESTGVYWKPIYNLLEGQFTLVVVNPERTKALRGRKTDRRDAAWLADLLRHGLVTGSFIPSTTQRELRDLTRYRTSLVRDRVRTVQRLQKVLEDANIKLGSVASDIMGVSARQMVEGWRAGETDTAVLADLARGRLREKRTELEQALRGRLKAVHRFLITEQLSQIDYLDEAIERLSAEIAERMRPFEAELDLLDSIPGINQRSAQIVIAELGADLHAFPSAAHLASWAALCPGNHESAGKRKSGKTRRGPRWLRQALVEAAHGAARTKSSYLQAQYRRLARRRGKQKAALAVGHSILVMIYHILTKHEPYRELGADHFDHKAAEAIQRQAVRRLERLGFKVELTPLAQAA